MNVIIKKDKLFRFKCFLRKNNLTSQLLKTICKLNSKNILKYLLNNKKYNLKIAVVDNTKITLLSYCCQEGLLETIKTICKLINY